MKGRASGPSSWASNTAFRRRPRPCCTHEISCPGGPHGRRSELAGWKFPSSLKRGWLADTSVSAWRTTSTFRRACSPKAMLNSWCAPAISCCRWGGEIATAAEAREQLGLQKNERGTGQKAVWYAFSVQVGVRCTRGVSHRRRSDRGNRYMFSTPVVMHFWCDSSASAAGRLCTTRKDPVGPKRHCARPLPRQVSEPGTALRCGRSRD